MHRAEHRTRRALALLAPAVALVVALAPAAPASATSYSAAAWGSNLYRQLGDGTVNAFSAVPEPVGEVSGVVAVAGGARHSLALLGTGTVMAWGNNEEGQLGTGGAPVSSNVPLAIPGLSEVKAIAAGAGYSLALLNNGTVMAWGNNENGQLGNGTTTTSTVPVAVKSLTGVVAIAAGANHSLALLGNGTVMAWGENELGQLGNGKTTKSTVPVAVKSLTGATAVAAGVSHSLALLGNGTVMAWGSDERGQLGNSSAVELGFSNVPIAVTGLTEVKAIAAGASHSLALLNNGTAMAWGEDTQGQLGNGVAAPEHEAPVAVSGLTGATAIAAGGQRSLALVGGAVKSWGTQELGSLGNGVSSGFSAVPVSVSGLSGVVGIAAGSLQSLSFGEPVPAVTSLGPSSGPSAGGTSVTITGVNLGATTAVTFGANAAISFIVNSASSITATAPPGSGIVDVKVTTPFATSPARSSDRYTYLPAPVVKSIKPKLGSSEGGTQVVITGTNFAGASAVTFGGTNATSYVVKSSTSITAVAPPHALGTVDIRVTAPNGQSAIVAADHFKYVPTVESLSPNGGPVAGGNTVTIKGTGFALGTTATTIKFGTKKATSVNCTSSTTCTALAPAHEAGTVAVRVTVSKIASPTNPGDLYTYS